MGERGALAMDIIMPRRPTGTAGRSQSLARRKPHVRLHDNLDNACVPQVSERRIASNGNTIIVFGAVEQPRAYTFDK